MDHTAYRHALAAELRGSELPFSEAEFAGRRQKVRDAMSAAGLDALLLTDPADIYYLTGYHTFEVSVHACLVCAMDRLTLQVPSIETGPAVVTASVDEVLGYHWECLDEVITPLCDVLANYRCIGIDGWSAGLRHEVIIRLQARLSVERFQESGALLDHIRIVKSSLELNCLRESARITATGIRAALRVIRPGVTDNAIAAEGARAMLAAGSEFMSMQPIVTAGRRISIIHVNHKRFTIDQDEPVFLEFGAAYQRYTAPMMCTAVAGRASDEMRVLRDLCRELFETLCAAMRSGNRFSEAALAAETLLVPWREQIFFSGVFGYAVGAQFPPSWVEGSGYIARSQHAIFETNMVFHLPICLRLPGRWGIGISDTVVVTPAGAVPLTNNSWQLQEMPTA